LLNESQKSLTEQITCQKYMRELMFLILRQLKIKLKIYLRYP